MSLEPEVIDRYRGTLKKSSPGARGLEQAARNLSCDRLQSLTLLGVTTDTALDQIYERKNPETLSTFALAAGRKFESRLLENEAEKLRELYLKIGRLAKDELKVVNLREQFPGKKENAIEKRVQATLDYLERRAAGDPTAPNLLIGARLVVSLAASESTIEPDLLVASNRDLSYRPVEIKAYSFKQGKTNPIKLRGACRQAAVSYVLMNEKNPGRSREPFADIILQYPGTLSPALIEMDLTGEIFSIAQFFKNAPRSLERLAKTLGEEKSLDSKDSLHQLSINFRQDCREFCALTSICQGECVSRGDLALFGTGGREALHGVPSVDRALELLHGRGDAPKDPHELALQQRLQTNLNLYREATRYAV